MKILRTTTRAPSKGTTFFWYMQYYRVKKTQICHFAASQSPLIVLQHAQAEIIGIFRPQAS